MTYFCSSCCVQWMLTPCCWACGREGEKGALASWTANARWTAGLAEDPMEGRTA